MVIDSKRGHPRKPLLGAYNIAMNCWFKNHWLFFTYRTLSYGKWLFFGMFKGVLQGETKVHQGGSVKGENGKIKYYKMWTFIP